MARWEKVADRMAEAVVKRGFTAVKYDPVPATPPDYNPYLQQNAYPSQTSYPQNTYPQNTYPPQSP